MTKAKMPVEIRQINASDKAQWRNLWTAYLGFYEASVSEEVYETTFERLLGDDPRDFACFVACQGETLVGLVHYVFHRHAWKIEEVCYLQDLYTAPDCRGMGVGKALIEAVETAAAARPASSVYWLTQDFNHTARRLYDQVATLTPFIKYQRSVS